MITSDKVYDNKEWIWGYRENDLLGGRDPYSASKGMAELAIKTYIESFFYQKNSNVKVGIARAGNVIGGGDWAIDRIIPDCIKAFSLNKKVKIRNPNATRPWQHVLEPLSGYLTLAKNLYNNNFKGEAYNFGPNPNQNYSVAELIHEMSYHWENVKWTNTRDKKNKFHEASLLKLNCDKALTDLNWTPTLNFKETVKMTVEWYKKFYQNPNESMYDFSVSQIDYFTKKFIQNGNNWLK